MRRMPMPLALAAWAALILGGASRGELGGQATSGSVPQG